MKTRDKLNFPVIKDDLLPPSLCSLDEINKWIEHDYLLFFDRPLYEKEKKKNAVNVHFSLK